MYVIEFHPRVNHIKVWILILRLTKGVFKNKYYQSFRRKKPLRYENYAVGVKTTIHSIFVA